MSKYNKYNIGEYLYNRLPSHHRVTDIADYNRILERYLEALNSSLKLNMEDLDIALARTQASKCPEEYLDKLAMSLGADWINTIHPKYQRQIISMLIKLYQQKGTIDTIRFIASELSGFEAKIIEGEIPDEYFEPGDEVKRLLTIKLQAPELDDPVSAQQHETTIAEVISNFVPVHTKFILVVTYFYDEPYYRRMLEKDIHHVDQDLGTVDVSINAKEKDITQIKNRYENEANFNMLKPLDDNMYELTIPNDKLVTSFKTVRKQYDVLVSKIKMLYTDEGVIPTKETDDSYKLKQVNETEVSVNAKEVKEILNMKSKYDTNSNFSMIQEEDAQYDVVLSKINNLYDFIADLNSKDDEEVQSIKHNPSDEAINIGEELSTNSKVVVKYNQEVEVKDLGVNCRVLKTVSKNTKISSISARVTTPSYIDKIVVDSQITYNYE